MSALAKANELAAELRAPSNWLAQPRGQNWKDGVSEYSRIPFEAADLIEAQAAEIERVKAEKDALALTVEVEQQKIDFRDKLIAKLESALSERTRAEAWPIVKQLGAHEKDFHNLVKSFMARHDLNEINTICKEVIAARALSAPNQGGQDA